MLPLLWLVLAAPPTALAVPPLPVLQPEVVQRLLDPPRCLAARCANGEWVVEAMPAIPLGQRRVGPDDLPGGGGRLRVPGATRDWVKAQGSNARVGMQYGLQALQTRDTSVKLSVDTGYRLKPYADDGIAGTGPIVRGQLEWNQALGRHARLSQVTRLETGQHGAFLRNSLLLNVQLQPALTLSSGVEMRRDRDLAGRDQTDATVKLKYAF
ncbi:DUF481 domain-containing protein [Thermomonas haemolytica]|uniref:Uncharacterized protein DUF481 n=1 Tax=Thermomonas haemolytica TaxID=141949 RepID=A0A4R3N7S0_9GAMM|nr:DUF481 domain-containing protein [Thermomonas haemolytica]TCT25186.1 uncharacterized protein DUF481 [Thermomonas haemolytica]TNY30312.1 hypothetical protein BV505_00395 [Thermomonas haemolytica]